MTRGNQREVDRQRAQKKQEEKLRAAGRVRFLINHRICIVLGVLVALLSHFLHFPLHMYYLTE